MTSFLTHLTQAQASIQMIQEYMTEFDSQEAFCNAQRGSNEYKTRAAALKEFEALAQNLHFKPGDTQKVLDVSGQDFVNELKQMYGLRDQIAHKYGVGDFKFSVVWEVFTTRLENALKQVQKLIEEASETGVGQM